MNIFEEASRLKLRFNLQQGNLTAEQLWDLKEESLIDYEETLEETADTFVKRKRRVSTIKTKEQKLTELRLAIVTHILDTKRAESEIQISERLTKEYNQKIMAILDQKREVSLQNMSEEELRKLLK